MRKALRYLRPFWLSVIAVVALVFGQVQFELALPDYMSRIVTYGIQYGGVTSPLPEALSETTYDRMLYFIEDEGVLHDGFERIEAGDASLARQYPIAKDEAIYILKEDSQELREGFEKPFLIVSMLAQSGEDVFAMLEMNPEGAKALAQSAEEAMVEYTEANLEAAEIFMARAEYARLGVDMEKLQSGYILHEGLLMLALALAGSLCAAGSAFLAARTATGACRNMRRDVFAKVESFSSEEFSRFSTASLITRTTNDIQQVQQIVTMMLRIMLFAPFMGLTALVKVMRYRQLAGILGWAVAFMIAMMIVTFIFTMPKFRIAQKMVDRLNLVTREQLSGMMVIRAFNNEEKEEERFDEVNKDMRKLNTFLTRVLAIMSPLMTFMMSFVSVTIIWIGARQIDLGTMQVGDMMAFLQYSTHVLMSFMIVAMIFIMVPRSSVSANRVFEILDTNVAIQDPTSPRHLPQGNQEIVFDHVFFRYPKAESNVLEDIAFVAKPGETVAFIGSTGSGKSTLINLLPRFFDVTEGKITYGGVDIRDVAQSELRDRIGYVPQKGVLFSGTVESNLRYADENATPEALERALSVAQASDFVKEMPEGIASSIAQGGTNVSGGQKQRLSIARALTKNADVFIFDDTFSALDYATDRRLRQALGKLTKETKATVLIVAQRISTIMHADKIVVLDNGKIAGMGRHEELMKDCKVYQEIAYSQLSKEELGA